MFNILSNLYLLGLSLKHIYWAKHQIARILEITLSKISDCNIKMMGWGEVIHIMKKKKKKKRQNKKQKNKNNNEKN